MRGYEASSSQHATEASGKSKRASGTSIGASGSSKEPYVREVSPEGRPRKMLASVEEGLEQEALRRRHEASSSRGAKEASGTSIGAVGAVEEAASARRRVLARRLAGAEVKKEALAKEVQVRYTHAPVCLCLCQCLSFCFGPQATSVVTARLHACGGQ